MTNKSIYFDQIVISEDAGYLKPDPLIFEYSMGKCDTIAKDCMMIGDNLETDIAGAKGAGIDQVYFNPKKSQHQEQVTYEISDLIELQNIL